MCEVSVRLLGVGGDLNSFCTLASAGKAEVGGRERGGTEGFLWPSRDLPQLINVTFMPSSSCKAERGKSLLWGGMGSEGWGCAGQRAAPGGHRSEQRVWIWEEMGPSGGGTGTGFWGTRGAEGQRGEQ